MIRERAAIAAFGEVAPRRVGASGPRVQDLSPAAEFEEPYGGVGACYGCGSIRMRASGGVVAD